MTDMFSTAASWFAEQIEAVSSVSITYHKKKRGRLVSSHDLTATLAGRDQPVQSDDGTITTFQSDDLLIQRTTWVAEMVAYTPDVEDEIEVTINGKIQTRMVTREADDKCWRWTNPHETQLRIHTKLKNKRDET